MLEAGQLDSVVDILNEADSDGNGLTPDEFNKAVAKLEDDEALSATAKFLQETNSAWLKSGGKAPQKIAGASLTEDLSNLGSKVGGIYLVDDARVKEIKGKLLSDLSLNGTPEDLTIKTFKGGTALNDEDRLQFSINGKKYSTKLDENERFTDLKVIPSAPEGSFEARLEAVKSANITVESKNSGLARTMLNGSFLDADGKKVDFNFSSEDGGEWEFTDASGEVKTLKQVPDEFYSAVMSAKPKKEFKER